MRNNTMKISTGALVRSLLSAVTVAGALFAATSCAAASISQVVVFGDSSVDAGYYRALANPGASASYNALWPTAVANGAGAPTSSPGLMYPQVLAARFGLTAIPANQPGGTNYATSGAKNVDVNTSANGGFKAAIPTVTQIANYLAANGGHADPNALYLISSGGNDLGFASGHTGTGPYPSDPNGYLTSRANSLATAIASLKSAGASRFVVALQQGIAGNYSQALLSSLSSQGVSVIVADTNAQTLAMMNNPSAYGFTSTSFAAGHTACTPPPGITTAWALLCSSNPNSPSTFSSPNADQTNLYADDQHLATAGQKVLADYVYGLVVQSLPPALAATDNVTGMWWNSAESGWGVNFNQQGNIIFASLFTYDQSGHPLWLVMSSGVRQADGSTFTGDLYQTSGSAFNANPVIPLNLANVTRVGSMTVVFSSVNSATLSYSVNGVNVTKAIQQQVFGSRAALCQATQASRATLTNYQDLWWNTAESGWGVNITHQDNTLFAALFTYDASGKPLWMVMSSGPKQPDGSYLGDLYQATGSPFNAQPFIPITSANITKVGTMQFRFSDGNNGTLSYTVNGVSVSKAIVRQEFSAPLTACN